MNVFLQVALPVVAMSLVLQPLFGGANREVRLPAYYRQADLPNGWRMCFTSSSAMIAKFHGKVQGQHEYNMIRARYGDTTSVQAHVSALQDLGLKVRFTQKANAADVVKAVNAGQPVMAGWYHQGDMSRGEPPMCSSYACGHWSVIHGYKKHGTPKASWIMSDPAGKPYLEIGGHDWRVPGSRVDVPQDVFNLRWQIDGPGSGWAIFVQ